MESISEIPGFTELKVGRHGKYWYIIDQVSLATEYPTIGGYHTRKIDAIEYAQKHYGRHYK